MHKKDLNKILGFDPNQEQKLAIEKLLVFCRKETEGDVFVLNGSAGTGKTSLVKAISIMLRENGMPLRICAPTSRAAKIIAEKTNHYARTIHGEIYVPETLESGVIKLNRKFNQSDKYTIFLIDESSMVSNLFKSSEQFIVTQALLTELIDYVKQGNKKNKIVFLGDKFQLPPINEDFSPALCKDYLIQKFDLKVEQLELTEVMRQDKGSNVLELATHIRDCMIHDADTPIDLNIDRLNSSWYGLDKYLACYSADEIDAITMICRSNKDVDFWNKSIRKSLGFSDSLLSIGDFVVTQDTWLNKKNNWIYKGEFGKVLYVDPYIKEYAGLHFVEAGIQFPTSFGKDNVINTKVMLESLNTAYGKLSMDKEKLLFAEVMKHNPAYRKSLDKADDEYLGSMRLRHAYATTCHKAQGGEWDNVLIHPWMLGKDLPWTYTALTRARKNVFSYAA